MKHLSAAEPVEGRDFPSEFRYDKTSGDWVVVASGRAKRPETFKKEENVKKTDPENCPFCKDEAYKYTTHVVVDGEVKDPDKDLPKEWSVAVIPNKFPAFIPKEDLEREENGPYVRMNAVGFHEVVITKGHDRSIGQMSTEEVEDIFKTYRSRFLDLKDKKNVNYISIFHNHGKRAGASIDHPHSQLATTPLVDVDVKNALEKAESYMKEKDSCLYCDLQEWEIERNKRVVYQNEEFLVICPYASKTAFQTIVTPKKHMSHFEQITDRQMKLLADAFREGTSRLFKGLNNPPYNYYLHTAPCDGKDYKYYHWHWTIMPRTSAFAGFEFGAGMEISTIKPEVAAKHLKNI